MISADAENIGHGGVDVVRHAVDIADSIARSTDRGNEVNSLNVFGRYRAATFGFTLALCTWLGALHASTPGDAFVRAVRASMDRMMTTMTLESSGDVDEDFVRMMTPHHQGGIDMARDVLRYGSNPAIRRIAQEIIIEQQQEIEAMHYALEHPETSLREPARGSTP